MARFESLNLSTHTAQHYTMPFHSMPRHAMPCQGMLHYAMQHHTTPCLATPHHVTPHHTKPCHAMPRHEHKATPSIFKLYVVTLSTESSSYRNNARYSYFLIILPIFLQICRETPPWTFNPGYLFNMIIILSFSIEFVF